MKTAFKIVLWSLIAISVGFAIWVAVDGSGISESNKMALANKSSVTVCMYWVCTVLGISLLSLIGAAVVNVISRPSGWKKTLISVGAVAVVVGSAVIWALCQDVTAADKALMAQHDVSNIGWNLSHIGLYAVCIVACITVLAVLYSVVNGLVQKAINAFEER